MKLKKAITAIVVGGAILFGGSLVSAEEDEHSIVNYLYYSGEEHNIEYRGTLASKNGIENYKGTAKQNIDLLAILKKSGDFTYNPSKQEVKQEAPKQEVKQEAPKQEVKQEAPKQEVKQEAPKQENNQPQGNSITMEATAYTAECTGCSGVTATGIDLNSDRNKKVVAVDPNVIPLGSVVHVEGYGEAIAGDTGGAIKGNRIDIHVPTKDQAYSFGRQSVKVTIIK